MIVNMVAVQIGLENTKMIYNALKKGNLKSLEHWKHYGESVIYNSEFHFPVTIFATAFSLVGSPRNEDFKQRSKLELFVMKILRLLPLKRPREKPCWNVVHHNKICFCFIG